MYQRPMWKTGQFGKQLRSEWLDGGDSVYELEVENQGPENEERHPNLELSDPGVQFISLAGGRRGYG